MPKGRTIGLVFSLAAVLTMLIGTVGARAILAQDATPGAGDVSAQVAAPAGDASGGTSVPETPPPAETVAPTEIATALPTEPPATDTPVPTEVPSPTPTPSPTAQVWVNHDTLTPAGDTAPLVTLQPDATRALGYTYSVTTPRTGTNIHAEIRDDTGAAASGWRVRLTSLDGAGDDWSAAGNVAEAIETATTTPDATFALTIAVRAPASVPQAQTVSLFIHMSATTPDGAVEQAGESTDAQLQVVPPPPTPTPTPSPAIPATVTPSVQSSATPVSPAADAAASPSALPATGATTPSCVLPAASSGQANFGSAAVAGASYPTLTSTVSITVSLPAGATCLVPDWSVAISVSDMISDSGEVIPAGAITFQNVSGLDAPGLTGAGTQPGAPLSSPQTIINGTGQTLGPANTTLTFPVTLELSPPPDAPPGAYSGAISVEVVAAP